MRPRCPRHTMESRWLGIPCVQLQGGWSRRWGVSPSCLEGRVVRAALGQTHDVQRPQPQKETHVYTGGTPAPQPQHTQALLPSFFPSFLLTETHHKRSAAQRVTCLRSAHICCTQPFLEFSGSCCHVAMAFASPARSVVRLLCCSLLTTGNSHDDSVSFSGVCLRICQLVCGQRGSLTQVFFKCTLTTTLGSLSRQESRTGDGLRVRTWIQVWPWYVLWSCSLIALSFPTFFPSFSLLSLPLLASPSLVPLVEVLSPLPARFGRSEFTFVES